MSKELISQLKSLKDINGQVNPDQSWVAQNRSKLMSQIHNNVDSEVNHFSFNKFLDGISIFIPGHTLQLAVRPVLASLLVFGLLTGSWVTSAFATEGCLPGDICYGVKLATEKTQEFAVAVIGSNTSKTQLQLEFATRRAKEVKKVMEVNPNTNNAKTAIQHLQDSMESAKDSVKAVGEQSPDKSLALARNVNDKAKEIVNTLKDVQLNTSTINNAGFAKDVVEIKRVVNEVKIAAVEMAAQKSTDGSIDQNKQEKQDVKNLVIDTIQSIVSENETAKIVVTEVKSITDQVVSSSSLKTNSTTIPTTNVLVPVVLTVSSTSQVVTTTKDLKNVIGQVTQSVEQKTEAVKINMQKAEDLANGDQLMQAMQIVRESNDATKEVQQAVVEVKGAVTNVVGEVGKVITPVTSSTINSSTVEKK